MSEWFSGTKEFFKLKRLYENKAREDLAEISIKKLSDDIHKIIQSPIFLDVFFTEILWIGSQARINPSMNGSLANFFASEAVELCTKFSITEHAYVEDYRKDLNTYIAVTVDLLKEMNPNKPISIIGCLSSDEANEINKLLDKFESIPISDSIIEINSSDQIKLLNKLSHCSSIEKINTQIEILLDIATGESEFSRKGLAALNYILQEEDAVPDYIGLLGLVDDFYVIQLGLQESQQQTKLLQLVAAHNLKYPNFKLPPLSANRKLIHLTNIERIVKSSYTNIDDPSSIKRVLLVPDIGPISVLCCLGKSICNRLDNESEQSKIDKEFVEGDIISLGKMIEKGKYIKGKFVRGKYIAGKYQGNKERSKEIIVRYLGKHDRISGAYCVETKKKIKESLPSNFLNKASVKHPATAGELSSTTELNNFRKYDPEASPWKTVHFNERIDSIPAQGSIFLFAQKNELDLHINEKIYGKSIKDLLGYNYVSRNFKISKYASNEMLFPEPMLYVCSDPDIAIEMINNRWPENSKIHDKPILIILDGDRFSDNEILIEELKHHSSDVVIFKEHFKKRLPSLTQAPFEMIPIKPDNFIDIKFDPSNSSIERFLNRSKPVNIQYKETLDPIGQELEEILKKNRV